MKLNRFLKEETVALDFDPFLLDTEDSFELEADDEAPDDDDEEDEELTGRRLFAHKERVIRKLVELIDRSGRITNPSKCYTDLRNREAKASTAIGRGVAIPHVRSRQAKGFVLGVAIAPAPGIEFDAIDDEPVRLFFPMVAPAHDDKFYLKVERALIGALGSSEELQDELFAATSPGEVIRILSRWID